MRPTYWGKYFWKVIHLTALGYPEDPDQGDKEVYKLFYETTGKVLPCNRCSNNYAKHIETLPLDPFLDSRDNLFKWTVLLHNIVNKDLGKPQWNVEYAESFYKAEEHRAYQQDPPICTTDKSSSSDTSEKARKAVQSGQQRSTLRSSWLSILLVIINILFVILIAVFLWKKM